MYVFASGQKYEGRWEKGKKSGWSIYTVETGAAEGTCWWGALAGLGRPSVADGMHAVRWYCEHCQHAPPLRAPAGQRWAGNWLEGKPVWVHPLPSGDAAPGGADDGAAAEVAANLAHAAAACKTAQEVGGARSSCARAAAAARAAGGAGQAARCSASVLQHCCRVRPPPDKRTHRATSASRAHQAASTGRQKALEHWRADGEPQAGLRAALAAAARAADAAQGARAKAQDVGRKLHAAARVVELGGRGAEGIRVAAP